MFRVLVTGGLILIFSIASVLVYTTVSHHTQAEVELQLHERLKGAHQSITHLQQLSNSATLARAEEVAFDPKLIELMKQKVSTEESYRERHEKAFALVTDWKSEFDLRGKQQNHTSGRLADWKVRKPYFFNVVDPQGHLVADMNNGRSFAKSKDANEYTQIAAKYPALKEALSDNAKGFYDVWEAGHQLLVGVSPIRDNGQLLGAVIIGYHINQSSQEYKRSLLADVGYFFKGQLQGSSTLGKEENTLEGSADRLIETYKKHPLQPIEVKLKDRTLLFRLGEFSGYQSADQVHFFVAVNLSDTLNEAMSIREMLLIYLVIALLTSLFLFWFSLHYFVTPIKDLEEGVIRVTNGDLNYWFTYEIGKTDISPTLSQHLDIMVSKLAGRDMPEITNDEDER